MPSLVMVTLGLSKHKAYFYRVVATQVKNRTEDGRSMQEISCRDAFPREKVQLARELAQRGMNLKKEGQVRAFRVRSSGSGCIPVLDVRRGQRDVGGFPVPDEGHSKG